MVKKSFIFSLCKPQNWSYFSVGLALAWGLNLALNIQPAHAAPPPKLKVVGNKFKDPSGNSVVLRGVSLTEIRHLEEAYGHKFMIDLLTSKDQGWYTKILRIPVGPDKWNSSNFDELFNRYLKPTVDYATQKGLYVIIDWHHINDPRNHQQDTKEFWQYIAPKFASYGNVFYELFNEARANARDGLNWSAWKQVAQPWINAIRQVGAPNVLLMCGPHFCQHMREAGADPFKDPMFPNQPNIAYVAHIYPGNYSRGSSLTDYDYELKPVSERFPVVITEWGWDRDFSNNEVAGDLYSYGNRFKEYVEQNQLSWTTWVANKDGWYPQLFNKDWTPRPAPRYHGTFTKDWLSQKRNSDQPQTASISAEPNPSEPKGSPVATDSTESSEATEDSSETTEDSSESSKVTDSPEATEDSPDKAKDSSETTDSPEATVAPKSPDVFSAPQAGFCSASL